MTTQRDWRICVYADGGLDPKIKSGAASICVVDEGGLVVEQTLEFGPGDDVTSNFCEYQALLLAIQVARICGAEEVHFVMDSQLVVQQVGGQWTVKANGLTPLHSKAASDIRRIDYWSLSHVKRELNERCDWLCNVALRPADRRATKEAPPVPPFKTATLQPGWRTMGKRAT